MFSYIVLCCPTNAHYWAGDLQAVLLRETELAAAVAAVCMTGLAATVQAARGPPKPDKARIDRLAYVVSAQPPCPHASNCGQVPSGFLALLAVSDHALQPLEA